MSYETTFPSPSSVVPGIVVLPRARGPNPDTNSRFPTRRACGYAPTGSGALLLITRSSIGCCVIFAARQSIRVPPPLDQRQAEPLFLNPPKRTRRSRSSQQLIQTVPKLIRSAGDMRRLQRTPAPGNRTEKICTQNAFTSPKHCSALRAGIGRGVPLASETPQYMIVRGLSRGSSWDDNQDRPRSDRRSVAHE